MIKKYLTLILSALIFTLLVPFVSFAEESSPKGDAQGKTQAVQPKAKTQAKPVTAQASTKVNQIAQAALAQGIINCVPRINQVSNYVGYSEGLTAFIMTPPVQPDQRIVPILMEIPTQSGPAFVSSTFAPNQANICGATFDAVVYWNSSCKDLENKQFSQFKRAGILTKEIVMLSGGVDAKIFLMPAGSGCISIKKEVVM